MSGRVCRRTGKIGYRSVGEARAAATAILAKETTARRYARAKRETSAFKCQYCPRWHLTSQWQIGSAGVNFDELLASVRDVNG